MNNTNKSSSSRRATVVSATFNFLAGAMQLGMVLVAMLALLASSAAAQLSGTGAISGIITDPIRRRRPRRYCDRNQRQ